MCLLLITLLGGKQSLITLLWEPHIIIGALRVCLEILKCNDSIELNVVTKTKYRLTYNEQKQNTD